MKPSPNTCSKPPNPAQTHPNRLKPTPKPNNHAISSLRTKTSASEGELRIRVLRLALRYAGSPPCRLYGYAGWEYLAGLNKSGTCLCSLIQRLQDFVGVPLGGVVSHRAWLVRVGVWCDYRGWVGQAILMVDGEVAHTTHWSVGPSVTITGGWVLSRPAVWGQFICRYATSQSTSATRQNTASGSAG